MVMRVSFEEIQRGLSEDQLNTLKETGVVIVKGGVPKEVATSWMQSLREYVRAHKEKVVGVSMILFSGRLHLPSYPALQFQARNGSVTDVLNRRASREDCLLRDLQFQSANRGTHAPSPHRDSEIPALALARVRPR